MARNGLLPPAPKGLAKDLGGNGLQTCGYPKLEDPPYRQSRGGSDEICPSCGIHFGNDDVMADNDAERHDIYARWRTKWVDHGMKWFSRSTAPPPHWDPQTQLENLRN